MGKAKPPGRYVMESWSVVEETPLGGSPRKGCPNYDELYAEWYRRANHPNRGWVPMHEGAAARVWRPVDDPVAAALHCYEWSRGIPAMQVRDSVTGEVVWRHSRHYPAAGPPIRLEGVPEPAARPMRPPGGKVY